MIELLLALIVSGPAWEVQSETVTRGYGIHQFNRFTDPRTGEVFETEIVRPTHPPIDVEPRVLVIESPNGSRAYVPTTNVEIIQFLNHWGNQ